MTEQWQELKEVITVMRDNGGTGTQQEVCTFLAHLINELEKEIEIRDATEEERKSVKDYIESISKPTGVNFYEAQPTDIKATIIKSALKYLVKMQIEEGSAGFAIDNDSDNDCCWDDVLAWLEAQPCEDCISREAVRKILREAKEYGSWDDSSQINRQDALDYVDMLPSVTPERPKGRWIKHDTGHSIYYDCSLCTCIAPCIETADATLWNMTNYCPNCGAKMCGGEENVEG